MHDDAPAVELEEVAGPAEGEEEGVRARAEPAQRVHGHVPVGVGEGALHLLVPQGRGARRIGGGGRRQKGTGGGGVVVLLLLVVKWGARDVERLHDVGPVQGDHHAAAPAHHLCVFYRVRGSNESYTVGGRRCVRNAQRACLIHHPPARPARPAATAAPPGPSTPPPPPRSPRSAPCTSATPARHPPPPPACP